MYICTQCGKLNEHPRTIKDRGIFNDGPYMEYLALCNCSGEYVWAEECECCGKYVPEDTPLLIGDDLLTKVRLCNECLKLLTTGEILLAESI